MKGARLNEATDTDVFFWTGKGFDGSFPELFWVVCTPSIDSTATNRRGCPESFIMRILCAPSLFTSVVQQFVNLGTQISVIDCDIGDWT